MKQIKHRTNKSPTMGVFSGPVFRTKLFMQVPLIVTKERVTVKIMKVSALHGITYFYACS